MERSFRWPRRALLKSLPILLTPSLAAAQAPPAEHGRVKPPVAVPDIELVRQDGVATTLPAEVHGRATALQVMFTSCSTSCPIQGAIFARVQKLIPDQITRGIQLLSLSVDPANDTPERLRSWLRRFGAAPGWIAAAPSFQAVARVRAFTGSGRNPADDHTTQILMIDRGGLLVFRTFELPEAEEIAAILKKM